MSQNAVAAHSGARHGSVSVAELLARHDQPDTGRGGSRSGRRLAVMGGGGMALLALTVATVGWSGQEPGAPPPDAAAPGPEHISASGVDLVDSIRPTAAPDATRTASATPAAAPRAEGHVSRKAAVPTGSAAAPERAGDAERAGHTERTGDTEHAGAAGPGAGSSGPSQAEDVPASGRDGSAGGDQADTRSTEPDGPRQPVADLVTQVTGLLSPS